MNIQRLDKHRFIQGVIHLIPMVFMIFLLSLAIGCKKETQEPDIANPADSVDTLSNDTLPNDTLTIDSIPGDTIVFDTTSAILIGEEDPRMRLNVFSPPIELYCGSSHIFDSYPLDVDLDGEADFLINCNYDYWMNGTDEIKTHIVPVGNSALIAGAIEKDSFFVCHQYINDSLIQGVIFNHNSGYICGLGNTQSFVRIDSLLVPSIHNKGDSIETVSTFCHQDLHFSVFNQSYYTLLGTVPTKYWTLTGTWSNVDLKYVLFKIVRNSKVQFGWIKLSVIESNRIIIEEYALQRLPFPK